MLGVTHITGIHLITYPGKRVGETHVTRDMCPGENISRENTYHCDVTVVCVSP